jgi:hypothetical protein
MGHKAKADHISKTGGEHRPEGGDQMTIHDAASILTTKAKAEAARAMLAALKAIQADPAWHTMPSDTWAVASRAIALAEAAGIKAEG